MMPLEVVINSYPRTGNTFLITALNRAYIKNEINWYNYPVVSHTHSKYIQRLSRENNFYQVSMIRNPLDAVSSYIIYTAAQSNVDLNIKKDARDTSIYCLKVYSEFYKEWLINKKARMIDFETIKNDINEVIRIIFNDINLEYLNTINNEDIIKEISESDQKNNSGLWMGHVPRDINSLDEYHIIKELLPQLTDYGKSFKIYEEVKDLIK